MYIKAIVHVCFVYVHHLNPYGQDEPPAQASFVHVAMFTYYNYTDTNFYTYHILRFEPVTPPAINNLEEKQV